MKITVITVCYNSAETIGRTLRSVREQTHPNVEHIIVDGASRDATLAVVATEGSHVAKVLSEKDKGIYDAMNKGVRLATGDVVGFLNADDFYKDSRVLERVARALDAESLDALYGDIEFFKAGDLETVVRRYNSGRFRSSRLAWGWMPAHPALYVRRDIFDRFGMFRTDMRIAGDFEFIARVFKHTELRHRHLPEVLVRMQHGGVSTSGWRATLQLNREMIRGCRLNGIPTGWLKMMVRYPLKILEFIPLSPK
jgi:glycosyltransferase involved in cell wall biosynthesis